MALILLVEVLGEDLSDNVGVIVALVLEEVVEAGVYWHVGVAVEVGLGRSARW